MAIDKKNLSILLVGGSGEGKSEFILSFINDEHRKKIPASGDGQTTRTSMVYTINREVAALEIVMTIKSKEVFCLDRVNAFMSKFNLGIIRNKRLLNGRKKAFIHDKAFFDSAEFINSSDIIEKKYDELFDDTFFESIKGEADSKNGDEEIAAYSSDKAVELQTKGTEEKYICDVSEEWLNRLNVKEVKKNSKYTLENCLTFFSEWVYDTCVKEIINYLEANNINLQKGIAEPIDISILAANEDALRIFIRAEEGKISYSSLVETIRLKTYVAKYYQQLFDTLRLESCIFVDTYGLDHTKFPEDVLIKDVLIKRYHKLFREYPDIDTVIYIRKARSNPPTDLDQNIPPLYMVKPSVMSYIVFTNVDRAGDTGKKAISVMRNPDSNIYDTIYEMLSDNQVNPELSEMRIKCMAENIVEYCSKTGDKYDKEEYEKYISGHPDQLEQLKKLLLSIRDKKHLGSQLISIDRMSLENMEWLLDINEIFSDYEDFYGYPGRTMGALGERLQRGILGFHSSTWDDFKYWDDEIFKYVKKRFLNISKEYDWIHQLGSENVVPIIQSLFNEFMDLSVKCNKDPSRHLTNNPAGDFCQLCDCKDKCIQSIIYEYKKERISSKYYPVSQWLTDIYDFSSFDNKTRTLLQDIFNVLYREKFIPLCRMYNARVLASEMNEMMTEIEIEDKIQQYFELYDNDLDEEGRILFEQRVNQFFD